MTLHAPTTRNPDGTLHAPTASAVDAAASLRIEHVRHGYAGKTVLDDVSWQVGDGEVVCLLGHSGCGKSTLLRLIAGLEAPTSGRILIGDDEMSGANRFVVPERRGVGLVFQDYALFPHLSVLANVMFGLQDRPREQARSTARQWLERVELSDRADSFAHMLSGGEQQRIALARAMAPSPRVLLMDEPFSHLDRGTRDAVRSRTIKVLRESRTTTVLVTHDAEEALRVADRIMLMHEGRIAQVGTPRELWEQPASLFVARFFGHCNELPALSSGGVATTALGDFPAPQIPDGVSAVACIPESAIGIASGGIEAVVLEREYLGNVNLLRVRIDSLQSLIRIRVQSNIAPTVGQRVHLAVDADAVRLFAEPPSVAMV